MTQFGKTLLILFFSAIGLNSYAQNLTVIKGMAPDFADKTISVFGFSDAVSQHKEWLASATLDHDGAFVLEFPCDEIRYVGLRTDHVTAYMYAMPNSVYNTLMPSPEKGTSIIFNDNAETEVIFNDLDLADINSLIIDFNDQYEGFFASNYDLLQRMFAPSNIQADEDSTSQVARKAQKGNIIQLREKMDAFSARMDTMYTEFDIPYFKIYRSAVLGEMMLNSNMEPRAFFDRFIAPYSFMPQHKVQTALEMQFFKHYFMRHAQSYGSDELSLALNEEGSYSQLRELMLRDDFLRVPERLDVVLCMAIAEVWKNKSMDQLKMAKVLTEINTSSPSKKAAKLAQDVLSELSSDEKGFPAYSFSLYNQFNDKISINGLQGRPVIIEFWASWCSTCLSEKAIFRQLAAEHKDDFYFLSINMDDLADIPTLTEKEKVIHSLIGISDPNIKEKYKVKTLPQYAIIDDTGLIYDGHALRPSEGLESILLKWKKKKEPNRPRVGGKEN